MRLNESTGNMECNITGKEGKMSQCTLGLRFYLAAGLSSAKCRGDTGRGQL